MYEYKSINKAICLSVYCTHTDRFVEYLFLLFMTGYPNLSGRNSAQAVFVVSRTRVDRTNQWLESGSHPLSALIHSVRKYQKRVWSLKPILYTFTLYKRGYFGFILQKLFLPLSCNYLNIWVFWLIITVNRIHFRSTGSSSSNGYKWSGRSRAWAEI